MVAAVSTSSGVAARDLIGRADSAVVTSSNLHGAGSRISSGPPLVKVEHRYKPKVDRHSSHAEECAILDYQRQIMEAQTSLRNYIANPNQPSREALNQQLETLYQNLKIADDEKALPMNFQQVQELREHFQTSLDEIQNEFFELEGKSPEDNRRRNKLNTDAINYYKCLIKTQIKLAQICVNQNRFIDRFPVSYLQSALDNSIRLANEINWQRHRQNTMGKTREIATVDFLGRTIWATSLAALDISVNDGVTVIRRGIWIHPHSRVRSIIVDLRKDGDIEAASDKLGELLTIFSRRNELFSTDSATKIHEGLLDLQGYIKTQAAKIQSKELLPELRAKVKALQEILPKDLHFKVRRDVVHSKDSRSGIRSVIHTLENQVTDYEKVSSELANVEHIAYILRRAGESGYLSKKNKDESERLLDELITWTHGGKVPEKTNAHQRLDNLINLINQGYQAQSNDKDQSGKLFKLAADSLAKERKTINDLEPAEEIVPQSQLKRIQTVSNLLKNRLLNISSISGKVKGQLNSLFIDMKDTDIAGSAAHIAKLFTEGEFNQVISSIEELNDLYLKYNSPEPGYNRVSSSLRQIYELAQNRRTDVNSIAEVNYLRDLIIADIEHKLSHRMAIIDIDEAQPERRYVFVQPETTRANLPRQVGGRNKKEWIKEGLAPQLSRESQQFRHYQNPNLPRELLPDVPEQTFFVSRERPTRSSPAIDTKQKPRI